MVLAVFNEGIQWSLDFGPDSVILISRDLVQVMTSISRKVHLPIGNLLLSQRQELSDNYFAQKQVTPNQKGTFKLREDFLASAGAQDMGTSDYELKDLQDSEFFRENPQVELADVLGPRMDAPFSAVVIKLSMTQGRSSKNPIALDGEKDKEKSPPTTQCLSNPLNLPQCSEVVLLENRLKICRKLFIGICLNKYIVCVVVI